MDEVINVCKRRGIIFQSSEIYQGLAGFFDYGPLGVELRNNIKKAWWTDMVHRRDDIVGLDSSIISSPRIWVASGHVGGFSDPMVDCKKSKSRFRADQLFWARAEVDGDLLGYVSMLEADDMEELAKKAAEKLKKKAKIQGTLTVSELKDFTEATEEEQPLIPSPATGEPGSLTPPRDFNLMFQTNVGAMSDASSVAYLRPETAQGIFTNFKNVVDTGRVKVPFGIAQIGKAFRNEITPRNFIFRSREFEQMEIEYFIPPDDDVWAEFQEQWVKTAYDWLVSIGVDPDLLSRDVHEDHKLAHYARACTDLMFKFPFGTQELMGIAARGNYDLSQHANASGKSMEYFDAGSKQKYVPHVIEPSIGVDRLMLAVLVSSFAEDEVGGEKRFYFRFHPRLAPVKVAVFPLVKNKPVIVEKAQAILKKLQRRYNVVYDETGSIGKRYRRMDEAGTPFCITVDFDTIEGEVETVTVRDRDSTEAIGGGTVEGRMTIPEVLEFLEEQIDG
jgi:glycyl-tRNA synthetase